MKMNLTLIALATAAVFDASDIATSHSFARDAGLSCSALMLKPRGKKYLRDSFVGMFTGPLRPLSVVQRDELESKMIAYLSLTKIMPAEPESPVIVIQPDGRDPVAVAQLISGKLLQQVANSITEMIDSGVLESATHERLCETAEAKAREILHKNRYNVVYNEQDGGGLTITLTTEYFKIFERKYSNAVEKLRNDNVLRRNKQSADGATSSSDRDVTDSKSGDEDDLKV